MSNYLWRVQIVGMPDDALLSYTTSDGETEFYINDEWSPDGWEPDAEYVERMGTHRFVWPTTNKTWKSRSSAVERARLLESFGATVVVQRSGPVVWPADGQERVPELADPRRLRAAVRELAQAVGVSSDVL